MPILPSGESALGPDRSGRIERPAPARKPYEVVEIEPGWGQDAPLGTVGWGGPDHEWDVWWIDAPVIVERFDHPDQPEPKHHGSKIYHAG